MRTIFKVGALVWGLGLVVCSGNAWAQKGAGVAKEGTPIGQMEAVKKSFMLQVLAASVAVNGSFRPRPDIAGLESKLRAAVFEMAPDATVEVWADRLLVVYQSKGYTTHLLDLRGKLSQEGAEQFPAGFREFRLEVRLDHDGEFYRAEAETETRPQIQAETFGATLRTRFDLRRLESRGEADARGERFALLAYDCLARAGFAKSRFPGGDEKATPISLMRREMAELVVGLHQGDTYTLNPALNRDLAMAAGYLQSSFAAETFELASQLNPNRPDAPGKRWRAPSEYLMMEFSYGKGVPAAFVERVQRTIEEYATQKMKESEAAIKTGTVPQWK